MVQAIVDAHHHLWDPEQRTYPFLERPANAPICRRFGLDDLAAAAEPHQVVETVVVQAAPELGETEELLSIASRSALVSAVVGWLDFGAHDPADQLDRLLSGLHGSRLAGVRAMAEDNPDPDWLACDAVTRAARAVGAAGLICDLLIGPAQAPAARALVQRLPEVQFVIDHAGKPPVASGQLEPWASEIRGLAALENTSCKISGLITEANWTDWRPDDIAPYVDVAAGAFGEDRILFGSDWPVCLLAGQYADVVGTARAALGGLTAAKVVAGNARRIYGLA